MTRPSKAFQWAFASALALCAMERDALAAACCGDGAGLGDRLGESELVAVTTAASIRIGTGSYDGSAAFHPRGDGSYDVSETLSMSALVRAAEWLELGAQSSLVVNQRGAARADEIGAGVGDLRAHARFGFVRSHAGSLIPGVMGTLGAIVPTGRGVDESESVLLADVAGQGDAELVFGVAVDGWLGDVVFWRADASLGYFPSNERNGTETGRAPRGRFDLTVGVALDSVALGVGIDHEREGPPLSAPPDAAGRHRAEPHATLDLGIVPTIDLIVNVRAGLPANGLGKNDLATVETTAAVRMAALGFL